MGTLVGIILVNRAKKNTEQNTLETKNLRVEINHRMDSFLALTQSAAFAAGLEDQRVNKTLP